MHFEERNVGAYRIYAGAVECSPSGFQAGVAVRYLGAQSPDNDLVFLNDTLFGGHRFDNAKAALQHALDIGHQVVRLETGQGVAKRLIGRSESAEDANGPSAFATQVQRTRPACHQDSHG